MCALGRKALITLSVAGALVCAAPRPASATICDLTVTPSCVVNAGIFTTDHQHAGTGVIDSFLRLLRQGGEQGDTTDARPAPVPPPAPTTQSYVEFFLGLKEPASTKPGQFLITLDQLEVFVAKTANVDAYSNTGDNDASGSLNKTGGGTPVTMIYGVDTNSKDDLVSLSYILNGQDNGSSDISFLLDQSLFSGYQYAYLYSQFGDYTPSDKQGQFTKNEENYEASIPEPAIVLLLGCGLAWCARRLRRA